MADYAIQTEQLTEAAEICDRHKIVSTNGVTTNYPRWPNAWAACEIVWRNYLEMKTMDQPNDESDREIVIDEANRLR